MKINLQEIQKRIDEKLIKVSKHPRLNLYIYNYTPSVQYDKKWDEYTTTCRGLILDNEGNVIANPLEKFFNLNEVDFTKLENLPAEVPQITEKVDGNLGIMYFENDQPSICTRGTFTNEQSEWATKWIRAKGLTKNDFKDGYTYLFEIICHLTRIVVNYKEREELILLAVRNTETGEEIDHIAEAERLKLPYVKIINLQTIDEIIDDLKDKNGLEMEGYVCKYSNGLRIKFKCEDYRRLHKILTGLSSVNIWESLMAHGNVDSIIEMVPDEFYEWVRKIEKNLRAKKEEITKHANEIFDHIKNMPTRKEQAIYIMKNASGIKGILFSLLDGRKQQAEKNAWRLLKPERELFSSH